MPLPCCVLCPLYTALLSVILAIYNNFVIRWVKVGLKLTMQQFCYRCISPPQFPNNSIYIFTIILQVFYWHPLVIFCLGTTPQCFPGRCRTLGPQWGARILMWPGHHNLFFKSSSTKVLSCLGCTPSRIRIPGPTRGARVLMWLSHQKQFLKFYIFSKTFYFLGPLLASLGHSGHYLYLVISHSRKDIWIFSRNAPND